MNKDNRQFYFDLVECCQVEFGAKVSHHDKMVLVSDLLSSKYDVDNMDGLEFHSLKRYIHSHIGGDFWKKEKNIAHTLGIKYKR